MIETMEIDGQQVPVIQSALFLVDLGETPASGQVTWFALFRSVLEQVVSETQGVPVAPVDVMTRGTGRMVLRIWAPDPDAAVLAVRERMDDGPEVQPL